MNCTGFSGNLTIPDSVTVIGDSAFSGCTGFTGSLVISEHVTTLESGIFSGCSGLTGSLTIPDSVTEIGESAFSSCSGLSGNLTIPDSVTTIGAGAFSDCSGLTGSPVIPDGATSIESGTYAGCSGLTGELVIPDSVTVIGASAFSGCSGLTGELVIPDSVTVIGAGAFSDCSGLTGSPVIPDGATSIESGTYAGCSSLTGSLTIPDSVTVIGQNAFCGCSGLTGNLIIPDSVTELGNAAFGGCSGMTGTLTLSKNLKVIKAVVFDGCSGLSGDLTIPDGVTEIGWQAFWGCSGLTGDLTIPDSVTTINDRAFCGCSNLKQVYFEGDAPTIGENTFEECELCGHYPKDNETWTSDKLQNYGGKIYWSLTLSRYMSVIPSNSYSYRGASIVSEYSQNVKIYCYETDELLVQDRDYSVEYSDPVNAGTCTVTVRGINDYDGINGEPSGSLSAGDGSLKGSFTIQPRILTGRATITLSEDSTVLNAGEYLYTGEAVCPEITVTCFMDDDHVVYPGMTDWPYVGNITLTKDKDYTVTYSNNTEPGTATITVEGIGNFCSTITVEFRILSTIELPSSVTEIGSEAFRNTAAEAVVVPETCEAVAADAFDNCPNLKYIVNNSNVDISADYEGSSVTVISNGNNS